MTDNLETDVDNNDKDEETKYKNKKVMPNYLPWDVINYDKKQEIQDETSQVDSVGSHHASINQGKTLNPNAMVYMWSCRHWLDQVPSIKC